MMTRFSTVSGDNLLLAGFTQFPATEKTLSDLLLAAGTAKTTLENKKVKQILIMMKKIPDDV
jgi:hypothetical protein